MSYQVLARKWRPKNFETLVGQEHVVRALVHALEQQRLHHAYLFTGTRGVGKTTLARILAKALNCETGITPKPCGQCSSCQEIDAGCFVDLIEVDAATNTKVDEMRQLLENAVYVPTRGRFKVYVIDEVHMLSNSAFNAMLKTLEEPPEHIKFILATTDPQKIPVTVLSRCLQFNLKKMPISQIVTRLQEVLTQEQIQYELPALRLLAHGAAGSMRDALSLLDQAIVHSGGKVAEQGVRDMLGVVDRNYLFILLTALAAKDVDAMLKIASEMEARSLSFDSALQELGVLLHQIALAQLEPKALDEDLDQRDSVLQLASRFDAEEIQLYYQIVLHGRKDLYYAPDEYAGFTMTLFRLLAFQPESETVSSSSFLVSSSKISAQSAPLETKNQKPENEENVSQLETRNQKLETEYKDWNSLITQLKISGMARELAKHCELSKLEETFIELKLPEAHKHLLTKLAQEKIQQALSDYFVKPVRLNIEIGQVSTVTPAEREKGEKQALYQRAIESLEQDGFVRDLIENFDATLLDSSIRPV